MISIHAGHNPDGLIASGAAGYMKESVKNRKIVNAIMQRAKSGIEDVTVNDGVSQSDILNRLCDRMNNKDYALNLSIHLNAGGGKGVECWTYGVDYTAEKIAEKICNNICKLGFVNRGVKNSKTLYILKHTTAPTIIVEVCFVDTEYDFELYNIVGDDKIGLAILDAISDYISYDSGDSVGDDEVDPVNEHDSTSGDMLYYVQVGAYSDIRNVQNMYEKLISAGFPAYIKK